MQSTAMQHQEDKIELKAAKRCLPMPHKADLALRLLFRLCPQGLIQRISSD